MQDMIQNSELMKEGHITVDFVKKIQKLPNLNLTGIHVYAANMLDTDSFLENL